MARLDRLAPVKEVAQIGAVHRPRVLATSCWPRSSPLPEAELRRRPRRSWSPPSWSSAAARRPTATYSFKHALVQDAAYGSLLKSRRQQLHARIAEVLEEQFPDVGETAAGGAGPALHRGGPGGAGDRLLAPGRRAGAATLGQRGGDRPSEQGPGAASRRCPNARSSSSEELALQLAIGGPLIATKGYAAPEVERTYSRAWALCDQLADRPSCFRCCGDSGTTTWCGASSGGPTISPRGWSRSRRAGGAASPRPGPARSRDIAVLPRPVHRRGGSAGRGRSRSTSGRGLGGSCSDLLLYTERAGVACRLYSAWALWFLGFPDRAWRRSKLASPSLNGSRTRQPRLRPDLGRGAARPPTRVRCRAKTSRGGDGDRARASHAGVARGRRPCAGALLWLGLGQRAEGIAQLQSRPGRLERDRCALAGNPVARLLAPKPTFRAGQFDDALSALDRATETPRRPASATIRRSCTGCGEVVLAQTGERRRSGIVAPAGDRYRPEPAGEIAGAARRDQPRPAVAEQGKRAEAHDLLAPVYGWFTEGFDTPDLQGGQGAARRARLTTSGAAPTTSGATASGSGLPGRSTENGGSEAQRFRAFLPLKRCRKGRYGMGWDGMGRAWADGAEQIDRLMAQVAHRCSDDFRALNSFTPSTGTSRATGSTAGHSIPALIFETRSMKRSNRRSATS